MDQNKQDTLVIGDQFIDKYLIGKLDKKHRFVINKERTYPGGLALVAQALHHRVVMICTLTEYSRYIDESGRKYFETINKKPSFSMNYDDHFLRLLAANNNLVLSLYNKGAAKFANQIKTNQIFNYLVTDQRYKESDCQNFNAKIKIWHATDKEYDSEFAKNFDYTIHTNGPKTITLYKGNQSTGLHYEPVQIDEPFSTCGAGDIFTGLLANALRGECPNAEKLNEDILFNLIKKSSFTVSQIILYNKNNYTLRFK